MASGARPRRRARWLVYPVLAAIGLGGLLLLIYANSGHPERYLRDRLMAGAGEALGRPVHVAAVQLRYFPPTVIVHDFRSEQPIMEVERVEATLSIRSLLVGKITILDLDVRRPVLHWAMDTERLLSNLPATPGDDRKGKLTSRLELRRLRVDSGALIVGSARREFTAEVDNLTVQAVNEGPGMQVSPRDRGWKGPWYGSATFSKGQVTYGELAVAGLAGSVAFSAGAEAAAARRMNITADGIEVRGIGEATLGSEVRIDLGLGIVLDPEAPALARPLRELSARRIEMEAQFSFADDGVELTGSFEAEEPSMDPDRLASSDGPHRGWVARHSSGSFEVREGRIRVTADVEAIAGGALSAIFVGTRDDGREDQPLRNEISMRVTDLESDDLVAGYHLGSGEVILPTARITGEASMQWSSGRIGQARGEADLRFTPSPGTLPLSGFASFRWEGDHVSIGSSALEVPGSSLQLEGTFGVGGPMPMSLTGHLDADDTEPLASFLVALLDMQNGKDTDPMMLPTDLRGGLDARFELEGSVERPHLTADFRSERLSLWLPVLAGGPTDGSRTKEKIPLLLESAVGNVNYQPGRLELGIREIAAEQFHATGRLVLDPGSGQVMELEADASAIPASMLIWLAGLENTHATGTLRTAANLTRGENDAELRGSFSVEAAEATVGVVPMRDLSLRASMGEGNLEIEEASVALYGGSVTASGAFSVAEADRQGAIEIRIDGIDLSVLDEMHAGPSVAGIVSGSGRIDMAEPMEIEGRTTVEGAHIIGVDLDLLTAQVSGPIGRPRFDLAEGSGSLKASGELHPAEVEGGYELDAAITINDFDLEQIRPLLAPGSLTGLNGSAAGLIDVHAPLLTPSEIEVHATLDRLSLTAGSYPLHNDRPARLTIQDRFLTLAPLRLVGEKTDLILGGSMALEEGFDITARLQGDYDLGLLEVLAPQVRASGPGTADLRVIERADTLTYSGTLTLDGATLAHPSLPLPLENLRGRGEFTEGGLFDITEIQGDMGGGKLRGSGQAWFEGASIPQMHLTARGEGIRAEIFQDLRAFFDADVTLTKNGEDYNFGGDVFIHRAIYTRPFGIDPSEMITPGREFAPLRRVDEPRPGQPTFFLDFDIRAERDLWIRNDDAFIEASAQMGIEGTLEEPQLTGRISAFEGGTFRFRDVTYRIVGGSIDFLEVSKIDPTIDIEASTRVQEYEVSLRISGRFSKPEYDLTSSPPLSQADIVWLLVSGQTLTDSGQAATAGVEANVASYLASPVAGVVSAPLEKILGVSSVQIDPFFLNGTTDPSARVTVTKRVSPKLLITYSTNVGQGGQDVYQIAYSPGRMWDLLGTRDIDGSIGGDVRFRRRWLGWNPVARQQTSFSDQGEPAGSQRLKVGKISIVTDHLVDKEKSLRRRLPFDEGDLLRRADLLEGREILRQYYVQHGYPAAHVEVFEENPNPVDPSVRDIRFAIKSGPDHSLRVIGDVRGRPIRKAVKDAWLEPVLVEDLADEARNAALGFLNEKGYYSAAVESELRVEPDQRIVRLELDKGPKVQVRSVSITGNEELPEDRIRRQILTRSSGITRLFGKGLLRKSVLEDDIASIRALYLSNGFLSTHIAPPEVQLSADGREADVTLSIDEGPQSRIAAVVIEGDTQNLQGEALIRATGLSNGQEVSPTEVKLAADRLREALDLEGYMQARVAYRIEGSPETTRVVYSVAPGERSRVEQVIIDGNTRTQTRIVRKEVAIEEGKYLSRSAMLETQRNLYQLGTFRSVQIEREPLEDKPGHVRVLVNLKEGPPLLTAWGLGYDNEDGIRGSFEVGNNNLFGTRRSATLFLLQSAGDRRAQVTLRDPNLLGEKIETLVTGFWERQEFDSFDVRRAGASAQLTREVGENISLFGRYRLEDVDLFNFDITEEEISEEDTRLGSAAGAIAYDTRDDIISPEKGMLSSFEARVYDEALGSEEDFMRYFGSASYYMNIGREVIWASSVRAGLLTSHKIPTSELFFAGGDTTVRGFERGRLGPLDEETDNPLGGQGLFVFNQELRFPILGPLRGVVFYDAGNVYREASDYDLGDLRHVAGVGFRLSTPVGPLRIEYGRKLDRESRDESIGELFFSIGQAF